jgi:hypothetical protein
MFDLRTGIRVKYEWWFRWQSPRAFHEPVAVNKNRTPSSKQVSYELGMIIIYVRARQQNEVEPAPWQFAPT